MSNKKNLIRLAYIVTEKGCMSPNTGAFEHIKNGIHELSKHFDLVTFLPKNNQSHKSEKTFDPSKKKIWYKQTGFWGMLRDLRDFIHNFNESKKIAHQLFSSDCKVAYIRVQGLHPLPYILKKKGVMVFLEANGLQFENRQQYFRSSWLSRLYRPFERFIYEKVEHVFFVGSYGQYWNLKKNNWSEVENGIELKHFPSRNSPPCSKLPIKLVFLASLTKHHQANLIGKALYSIPKSYHKELELHLIGDELQNLKKKIPSSILTIDHGFIKRSEIGTLLTKMDIGLIPGGPTLNSQMKFMDYAAAGCVIIGANITHLINFYEKYGVLFFKNGSAQSLSENLVSILNGNKDFLKNVNNLESHIKKHYQWSQIFNRKAACILSIYQMK